MRRILRIVIIVVVLAILVSAGILYAQFQSSQTEAQQSAVKIEDEIVAAKSDLTVTVNATGAITPQQQLALGFDFSAPVKEISVKEGQLVKKGDILARLDAPDLENAGEPKPLFLYGNTPNERGNAERRFRVPAVFLSPE